MKKLYVVTIILLISASVYGQFKPTAEQASDGPNLSLINGGNRTLLVQVAPLSDDVKKLGLSEERIRTKIELRLRQAGIIPLNSANGKSSVVDVGFLMVNIVAKWNGIGYSFGIQLAYNRPVSYFVNGKEISTWAFTWYRNTVGSVKTGEPEYVLNSLDGFLDNFINDYLKQNH